MGGTFVFARYAILRLDPFVVAFLRFCLAASVLILMSHRHNRTAGHSPIPRRDQRQIWLLGLVIIIFNQTLYLFGQKFTTAAHGALLFSLTPIFVYLMAMSHLGERWSVTKGLGILLAVAGSAVIMLERGFRMDLTTIKGDLIILVAVVAWGYYLVWGKPLVEKYGALRVTAYALGAGTLIYFPFGLYRLIVADWSRMDLMAWGSILYVALITSVVGYTIWFWLLKRMEATRVSVLANMQPIVAGVLGIYLLGEAVNVPFIIGALIILGGVTIAQKA